MTATPEVVKVLEEARARIAKGWCQRSYAEDDAVCLVGAVNLAAGMPVESDNPPCGVELRAYEFLGEAGVDRNWAEWNDAPGRTQAEVVAAFDRAIALAQAQP